MPSIQRSPKNIRILVPTDLSAASRAGLRFAIQWSRQQETELVFCTVVNILKPPSWSEERYKAFATQRRARYMRELRQFVRTTYKRMDAPQRNTRCILLEAMSVDIALQDYCRQDKHFDYICISTRGAGRLHRIFGTHTGNLITHSEVPVMAVPVNYRQRPIRKLLYAGDMVNYQAETARVVSFAKPLKASINLVHFMEAGETVLNRDMTEQVFRQQFAYDIRLHFRQPDPALSFAHNLDRQVALQKPSVVVLFTDQHRSFTARLFDPSRAERLSFALKTPLLVFPK